MNAIQMRSSRRGEAVYTDSNTGNTSIVVAVDGSEAAEAALTAAKLIEERHDAAVHVVSVIEPLPAMFALSEGLIPPAEFDSSRQQVHRALIGSQVRSFDPSGRWSMDIVSGSAAEAIVGLAHELRAGLIIVGAHKHGMLGRILGEETAIEIARLSDIPLLVAPQGMKRIPNRVVVAMRPDWDDGGLVAEALQMVAERPSTSVVHVKPKAEFLGIDWSEFDRDYEISIDDTFKMEAAALAAVQIHSDLVVLRGDPVAELVDFANFSKSDMLVVGIHRRYGKPRAVGGKLASRIIRRATCSVLVVPMTVRKTTPKQSETTEVTSDRETWNDVLREFTARNAGRLAKLEEDDPEIGAVTQANRYPLVGVDYDRKDRRLSIMLGYTRSTERHLTRSISHPRSISVVRVRGRDTALSVAHDGGQSLLSF